MNLKVKHLLIVVLFFSTTIYSQNLKSIYKNIVKEDYDDVQSEYNKSNNEFNQEEKILLELSKCILYSKSKYHSFKPREAYSIYKSISIINLSQIEQTNINEFLSKYTYTITGIYDTIIKGVYIESKTLNTIESYEEAIQICNDCKYKIELLNLKEATAYKQAVNYGNIEVLEQFLKNYPTSKSKDEIEGLLHIKAFDKAILINTVTSLNEYIDRYTKSKLISTAYRYRDSLVLKSINKTYKEYLAFNHEYPNSSFNLTIVQQLPDLLFNEISVDNDYYKMLEFVEKYHKDTRVQDVKSRIKSMKYFEISVNKVNNLKIKGDCKKHDFILKRKNNLIYIRNIGYVDTLGNLKYEEYFDIERGEEGIRFGFDYFIQASIKGKYGILDTLGNIIVPFKYEKIWVEKEYIIVKLNDKMGVLDFYGKELIPNIYEKIDCSRYNKFFEVELNKKQGYIDSLGKIIIPIIYDNVVQINDLYFEVELNGKYGVLDKSGKVLIPIIYDGVNLFMNDYFEVYLNNKYGVSNNLGEIIVPLKYDEINSVNNNIIKVELNKKSGLVDFKGSEIIPIIYDKFPLYEYGVLVGQINNQCVFIDSMGHILSTVTFNFSNFKVNKFLSPNLVEIIEVEGYNNKFKGIVDIKGNIILPTIYNYLSKEGDLILYGNKKYPDEERFRIGLINLEGKVILPLSYALIYGDVIVTGNYYGEYKEGVYGNCIMFDNKGNQISKIKYNHITYFEIHWSLPTTKDKNGKWNYTSDVVFQARVDGTDNLYFFNKYGKTLPLSNKFNNVTQITNDCYIGEKDGKYSLVDKYGNDITQFKYESIREIVLPNQITFICKKNGKYGLVDIHGKILIQFIYDDLIYMNFLSALEFDFRNGIQNQEEYLFYLGKKNGKYGILNNDGKELTDFKYEEITAFAIDEDPNNSNNYNKIFKAKFNGKYGLIDFNGLELFPFNSNNFNIMFYTSKNYVVQNENNYSLYDANGNLLTESKYEITEPAGNFFISRINDKYGIIDKKGNEITEFKYSYIEYLTNDIIIANDNCEFKIIKILNK
jgi:hypothetical protein